MNPPSSSCLMMFLWEKLCESTHWEEHRTAASSCFSLLETVCHVISASGDLILGYDEGERTAVCKKSRQIPDSSSFYNLTEVRRTAKQSYVFRSGLEMEQVF